MSTSQDRNIAESGTIFEGLQRDRVAGSVQSVEDSDDLAFRNFNFSQLEKEFHRLSPGMQQYLILLERETQSEYLFTSHDQVAPSLANVDADLSQR